MVSKGGHTGQAVNVGAVELALGCTIYAVGASRTGEGGRNSGEKSCIATRVAGSEPLKISTPASPLHHPAVVRSIMPRLCFRVIFQRY